VASGPTLIGREPTWSELALALAATARGRGGFVLLAGEAGVGKTRLANEVLNHTTLLTLRVSASSTTASAYGLLATALRSYRRQAPSDWLAALPLGPYLAVLLPELGSSPPGADRATVFEAVRSAFEAIATRQPTVLFFDDLQLADYATLELLASMAPHLSGMPLLVVAAYRTDELRRDHPLRRIRADLRRGGLFREIVLQPLGPSETAMLASQLLGLSPTPELAALLHEHADGLPFFVEELVMVLRDAGRLRTTGGGVELASDSTSVPVPETVRDLVLLRTADLSEQERAALEVASVAGISFDLDLIAALTGSDEHLQELMGRGFLVESEPGVGAFRHALIREACYREISWPRRRALHRQIADHLEARGATAGLVAEHWFAARELDRARQSLVAAMEAACSAHAYRDAAEAGQRALEIWPDGQAEAERAAVLDRLGRCAQLSGDLAEAARAWREVAETHQSSGDLVRLADTQRQLATVFELQGAWPRALAARAAAAAAYAALARPGDAAAERLAAATHLRASLHFTPALELLAKAAQEAQDAGRVDLQARIMGVEGSIRARMGQYQAGLEQVRAGLQLALENNLSGPAAEVYQRLADALEHAGDLAGAKQTYLTAAEFCQTQGVEAVAQLCLACMTAVLRQTGEWDRCLEVCREVLAGPTYTDQARAVALGMLGLVHAQRGEASRARHFLLDSERLARRLELAPMELLAGWGLALVDEVEGALDSAADRGRAFLDRWRQTEERHYGIAGLRWAASLLADRRADADVRACASALAHIVAETGSAESVAALGHALGEVSLLGGNADQAQQHFRQALTQLESLELPYESIHTRLRAGMALLAAGERSSAVEMLVEAYRRARTLGARPLAAAAARELANLGERVDRRLGRRAVGLLSAGGLTRRELEVLRLVAGGHTDREIAAVLVVSPRTVEMHVANGLAKLGSRTRAEAVRRAAELNLLEPATVTSAPVR
jgi:DNA-binding CsgD family transcriptional regulator